jgi:hypothetical protein
MDLVRPFQFIALDTSSLEEGEKKASKQINYQQYTQGDKEKGNEL